MSNTITELKSIGLEENPARVYLACLELGRATVFELAQHSGVKRTSIYNYVEELKNRHLISEIKESGRLLYTPESPETLLRNERERMAQIESMLPELMGIYSLPGNKPKVKYYEGESGILRAYSEMFDNTETIYGYSDYEKMFTSLPEDKLWPLAQRRINNNQKFYCLAKDGPQGRLVQSKDDEQLRETRFIPNIELDTEINIYGNKVLLVSFRRPYAAVIVEDRAIAMSLKSIWQINWNMFGNTKNHTS